MNSALKTFDDYKDIKLNPIQEDHISCLYFLIQCYKDLNMVEPDFIPISPTEYMSIEDIKKLYKTKIKS